MNHAGSSGPTNADASTFLPDSLDDDFYMDHPEPMVPVRDDPYVIKGIR